MVSARQSGEARHTGELDRVVLAVIARSHGMTAYQVRREFGGSPAPQWSSSAGSIYPAVKRLISCGLVQAGEAADGRGKQLLTVTPEGRREAEDWVLSIDDEVGGPVADPLHTRAQFLSLLTPAARAAFIARAANANEQALAKVATVCRNLQAGRTDDALRGALGVFHQLKARQNWLREIGEAISEARDIKSDDKSLAQPPGKRLG